MFSGEEVLKWVSIGGLGFLCNGVGGMSCAVGCSEGGYGDLGFG